MRFRFQEARSFETNKNLTKSIFEYKVQKMFKKIQKHYFAYILKYNFKNGKDVWHYKP